MDHSNSPARTSRDEGFTLIEVMIALVLLLIGMTGVALAQLQSMRSTANSTVRSRALYLAEEQLEAFQAMWELDPQVTAAGMVQDPANPLDPNPNDNDLTQYYRCWNIVPNSPIGGLTTITVEVRPGNPGNPGCNAAAPTVPFGTARITGVK